VSYHIITGHRPTGHISIDERAGGDTGSDNAAADKQTFTLSFIGVAVTVDFTGASSLKSALMKRRRFRHSSASSATRRRRSFIHIVYGKTKSTVASVSAWLGVFVVHDRFALVPRCCQPLDV